MSVRITICERHLISRLRSAFLAQVLAFAFLLLVSWAQGTVYWMSWGYCCSCFFEPMDLLKFHMKLVGLKI